MSYIRCGECDVEKHHSEFDLTIFGRRKTCRPCLERAREYKRQHKEERREYERQNKEHIREMKRSWYERNKNK